MSRDPDTLLSQTDQEHINIPPSAVFRLPKIGTFLRNRNHTSILPRPIQAVVQNRNPQNGRSSNRSYRGAKRKARLHLSSDNSHPDTERTSQTELNSDKSYRGVKRDAQIELSSNNSYRIAEREILNPGVPQPHPSLPQPHPRILRPRPRISKPFPDNPTTALEAPEDIDMPYNNQAIPPTTEPLGAATLPLARVKKILAQDDEINSVAANSAFAITIATEMFIRYLAEKSYDVAKSDSKKPRRTIAYSDVAEAVARIDNLEFLQDLIPKTSTFGEFKAKKVAKSRMASSVLQAGQTTLDGKRPQPQQVLQTSPTPAEVMELDNTDQAGPSNTEVAGGSQNGQPIVFEHYQGPNGTAPREQFSDVEMEQEQ